MAGARGAIDPADHRDDLVGGHSDARGVFAQRLRIDGLVDAHGAQGPVAFRDGVGTQPADLARHFLVADAA